MAKSQNPKNETSASGIGSSMNGIGSVSSWRLFHNLTNSRAVLLLMAIVLGSTAFVYGASLWGQSLLLYTDIGSDSVNDQFPVWLQKATMWQQLQSSSGFSLSSYMGSYTSFKIANPFDWILILQGPDRLMHGLSLYVAAGLLATALTGFLFFKLLGSNNWAAVLGSLSLAFCGYLVLWSAGWFMGIYPVLQILLGLCSIEYVLTRRKFFYVAPIVATAYVAYTSTYFFAYWLVFTAGYAAIRSFESENDAKSSLRALGVCLGLMAVGVLASWTSVAELYDFVTNSGRALSIKTAGAISAYGTNMNMGITDIASANEYRSVLSRFLSNNLQGAGSNYRGVMNYLEGPLLYMGVLNILFVPVFFLNASKRQRWLYGSVIGISALALVFPWFRLAFWGFRLDYFREFSLFIGICMTVVSARGMSEYLQHLRKRDSMALLFTSLIVLMVLLAALKAPTHVLPNERNFVAMLLLAVIGTAVFAAVRRTTIAPILLLLIAIVDLTHNADVTVNSRSRLSNEDIKNGKLYGDASLQAIRQTAAIDSDLYRTAKYFGSGPAIHASINDAMVQGFYGITGYASIHNKYYLKFMSAMDAIDLSNPSQGKWVSGAIGRPFLASAVGVKYYLTKDKPFGFIPELFPIVDTVENVFVQKSLVSLPLVVGYNEYIRESDFMRLPTNRKDQVLYRSVIVDDNAVGQLTINRQIRGNNDTMPVTPQSFTLLADQRKQLLRVKARTDYSGLYADVYAAENCVAVLSVPYDERLTLKLDGVTTQPIIGNIGFFAVNCPKGRHQISISVD